MEKSDNSKGESLAQVQPEDACQQQCSTRSKMLHTLRRALLDSKRENKELAAENTALKEQIASKNISWKQEKKKTLDERDSLVSTLFMARNDLDSLVKALESERNEQKHLDAKHKEIAKKMREKEGEVGSLRECLHLQQIETERVKMERRAECDQVKEMELSCNKSITQFNAAWKSRLTVFEEKAGAELKSVQENSEKRLRQIIQEKDEALTSARTETMALVEKNLEHLDKLKSIEAEIHQKETEWQAKVDALEDSLRCEQAEKVELQKHSRATCEEWLTKQQDWLDRASRMEEEIKLLVLKNTELQELHLKSAKHQAKIKKEEKKAKKEEEKSLKKEMKEKKEQEKREKLEREKKEKEKLRAEKKEKEEREKGEE